MTKVDPAAEACVSRVHNGRRAAVVEGAGGLISKDEGRRWISARDSGALLLTDAQVARTAVALCPMPSLRVEPRVCRTPPLRNAGEVLKTVRLWRSAILKDDADVLAAKVSRSASFI